jgi:hypothetical protein
MQEMSIDSMEHNNRNHADDIVVERNHFVFGQDKNQRLLSLSLLFVVIRFVPFGLIGTYPFISLVEDHDLLFFISAQISPFNQLIHHNIKIIKRKIE